MADKTKTAPARAAFDSGFHSQDTTEGPRQSTPRDPLPILPALLRRIASGHGDDVAADALRLSALYGADAVIAALRVVGIDLLNEEARDGR